MFPLTLQGTIITSLSGNTEESLEQSLAALTNGLRKQKPDRPIRTSNKIRFEAGIFRLVSNWNLLAPITTGEIIATTHGKSLTVWYKVTFTQLVIIATVAVVGLFGPSFGWDAAIPLVGRIIGLLSAWIWLVGFSYLITAVRFPQFLRSTLSHPPTAAEAARYPELECPDFPEYGPKSDQIRTIKH